jgi:hypothetical protein
MTENLRLVRDRRPHRGSAAPLRISLIGVRRSIHCLTHYPTLAPKT